MYIEWISSLQKTPPSSNPRWRPLGRDAPARQNTPALQARIYVELLLLTAIDVGPRQLSPICYELWCQKICLRHWLAHMGTHIFAHGNMHLHIISKLWDSLILFFEITPSFRSSRLHAVTFSLLLFLEVPNRPFYSCLLIDLAFGWQRGWSWPCFDTDLTAFVM